MTPSRQSIGMRGIATALSFVTAAVYFLIAFGFGSDVLASPSAPVMFIAGLAYLVGGILILRVGKRLLQLGAGLNLLVLLIFGLAFVTGNAAVDPLSVIGKIAQVGLEIVLIWIVFSRSAGREP